MPLLSITNVICSGVALTIIFGLTCYSVFHHRKRWYEPEAQLKVLAILLYPLVGSALGFMGVFFCERGVYAEVVRGVYEGFSLYLYFRLLLYYYDRDGPRKLGVIYPIDQGDRHQIDEVYKEGKVVDLFSFCTEYTFILPLTKFSLWVNMIGKVVVVILTIAFYEIGLWERVGGWVWLVSVCLWLAPLATLTLLIYIIHAIISPYYPINKLIYLVLAILLSTIFSYEEFFLLTQPLLTFLAFAFLWVFPYDEHECTSLILMTHLTHVNHGVT